MLLVGRDDDRIADADPLRIGPASLHPSLALDDEQELATHVGMPVITSAGLEPDNRARGWEWRRCRQQWVRTRFADEVGRLHRREVGKSLALRRDLHAPTLRRAVETMQGSTQDLTLIVNRNATVGPAVGDRGTTTDLSDSIRQCPRRGKRQPTSEHEGGSV